MKKMDWLLNISKYLFLLLLWLILCQMENYKCAKIVGIFPVTSRSHHSINQPILKKLASRGHIVNVISNFKNPTPQTNYRDIPYDSGKTFSFLDSITVEQSSALSSLQGIFNVSRTMERVACEQTFKHDAVKKMINRYEEIDLLVVESYGTNCYNLLAEKLNVPLIVIMPPSHNFDNDFKIGNVNNPSFVPVITSGLSQKMTFWQRFYNTLEYLYYYYRYATNELFNFEKMIAEKYLNITEIPPRKVLERRIALVLFNNHHCIFSTPNSPNTINIGGIHIKEAKSLSAELEKVISESKHGVIFFSFGTTIKASSMPPEKLNIFKNVFSRIPQTILWRVNDPRLFDLPSNVITSKWFPQRDILEHKNVKAFISHCGLLGTQEAIHTATPVIGIPFFFDQKQDANILAEKGMGIHIDYYELTEDNLLEAINEVVNNTKYAQNAQKLSSIFRDRLVSPLDEAMYWVEYVLRHKGAPTLRTAGADLPLYQYLLLDVFAIIFISAAITLWIVYKIIKIILSKINSFLFPATKMKKYKMK